MKFNDNITLDIAKAVSDVLEGKVKKEEMDPTDHVKKSDEGKFCVYNAANKKVKEFDTKDEADKYAVDNHDKLMAAKNEVAEPRAKGEKDFKDKHVKKVSGMKNDGTNIKEAMLKVKAWTGSLKKPPKGLEIAKSQSSSMGGNDVVFKGDEKDLITYAKRSLGAEGDTLGDIQRTVEAAEKTPTGPAKEESEKQKKYQAFFSKALKKFGVKSPSELEGDKKKDFFDYVDANYEADDEPEEGVKEGAEQVDEILGTIKKVAQKVKDKVVGKKEKPQPTRNPVDMKKLLNNPGQIKARLIAAKQKLKDAEDMHAKATKDDNEKGMEHWSEVELNRHNEVEKLTKKLKDAMAK